MNLIEKIKGIIMLGKILSFLDGKKTYLAVIAWGVYRLGVIQQWWPENITLETLILGAGGLALREAIAKSEKK